MISKNFLSLAMAYTIWVLVLLLLIGFCGCTDREETKCHHWSIKEKELLLNADRKLSFENPIHGIIKDYERICSNLN